MTGIHTSSMIKHPSMLSSFMRTRLSMSMVTKILKEENLSFIISTMIKTKSGMSFMLTNLKERIVRPSTRNSVSTQVENSSLFLQCQTTESSSLTLTTSCLFRTQFQEPQVPI